MLATLLLLALTVLLPPSAPPEGASRTAYVMGTRLHAEVEDTSMATVGAGLEAAIAEVERFDRLLSTWDPTTPVAALNRAPPGEAHPVPPELLTLLVEAEAWAGRTARAFDPTMGPLADAWHLRDGGGMPTTELLAAALERTGPEAFLLEPLASSVTRRIEGAWIDTGAFGKGAALRSAEGKLRSQGVRRALLDLGGQLLAVASATSQPWMVAVAHPLRRDEPAAWLALSNGSAATSGNSERGLVVGGERVGHLLDPRTGLPAPDFGSVTVVSADPLEADILSTALYVMGPDAGLAWADRLSDVGVLFLVVDGEEVKTLHNQAMERWLAQPPADAGPQNPSSPERRIP